MQIKKTGTYNQEEGTINVHKSPYDWKIGGRESSIVKALKLKDGNKVKITIEN
jgi:hypothetical protein